MLPLRSMLKVSWSISLWLEWLDGSCVLDVWMLLSLWWNFQVSILLFDKDILIISSEYMDILQVCDMRSTNSVSINKIILLFLSLFSVGPWYLWKCERTCTHWCTYTTWKGFYSKQLLLGIDKRTVSKKAWNEKSNENAKKAPAEENRTLTFDTGMKRKMRLNVIFTRDEN